ncbi:MAG: ABC transporter substrate-binding protein [Nitrospirae bacterium]|nr:ABC transporter substrate-binding protein [Nitrospirota bacterium]
MRRFRALVLSLVFVFLPALFYSQGYPQRIISLSPAITEELYLLGAGERIVANTVYCKRPPEAEKKEKIGSAREIDIEGIIALRPDLVIATSLTSPKSVEKLKGLGINVVVFHTARNFSGLCNQFLELAKLIGKEKEAQKILKSSYRDVEAIRKSVAGLSKTRVIVQIGARPLWVATKDSFINDFIEFAGGINLGPFGKGGLYSREEVLKRNPDVIIITTMGIVGKEEKKIWQKYKTISAVRNNRIYIVDSDKLCSPTPVSFVETLEEMVNILHPHI